MRRQGRDDSALDARTSSSRGSGVKHGVSSSTLPVALASHLNAAVMLQQLGKSSDNVPRGKNWAPSSDSEEEEKPAQPTALVRSHNPFQPALDALFKPIGELLCPMLMPASHDALVREYCEELEKDRSHLAQQNMALEKELEKLKLSAAKRQRGKTVKEGSLDKFVAMRVAMANLQDSTEEDVAVKAAWTAWDKRDRPITDRQAARAASRQDRTHSPTGNGSDAGSRVSGSSYQRRQDDDAMLDHPAGRAALVSEWILTLLATKHAHPETVTLEEVGPLMGLLYAFPRDERVQAAGAESLALIAMDEGDSARLSAEDLVEEGAITVLKEAMRNHRKNARLQEQAGSALLHMASRSPDVAIEIQQAGGTRAISAAIKLHPQLKYLAAYMEELLPPEA